MAAAFLRLLRALASECQLAATSFSDEQAAEGFAVTDELRAIFLPPPASAASSVEQTVDEQADYLLQLLPPDLMTVILSHLDTRGLACLAATCPSLWRDAPPPRPTGLVETELRRRAEARGLHVGFSRPEGARSWVSYLLASNCRDALRRHAPLGVGETFSIFVDRDGRLHSCGSEFSARGEFNLGHAMAAETDLDAVHEIALPTPLPSMQGTRIVSVATSGAHCLALSAEGEVYAWGVGGRGELGHADEDVKDVPCMIESFSRIEHIAAGIGETSAAIDEGGNLYTWVNAFYDSDNDERLGPSGLGYELEAGAEYQPTPKRVDALSQNRVVGVALGRGFTLAVTDAGAVFSFGYSDKGALGHGSLESVVLPQRIEALAQTGRRFVAVAAGFDHALALTEEGELYGWGKIQQAGERRVPQRIGGLVGRQVKLIYAASSCGSCLAVTENGELYSWSYERDDTNHLGHGINTLQKSPKRVKGLSGVKVAAVAMSDTHTLVAGEDGVVWGFGLRCALGLDDEPAGLEQVVERPVAIPALRVRALKSPPVVRL